MAITKQSFVAFQQSTVPLTSPALPILPSGIYHVRGRQQQREAQQSQVDAVPCHVTWPGLGISSLHSIMAVKVRDLRIRLQISKGGYERRAIGHRYLDSRPGRPHIMGGQVVGEPGGGSALHERHKVGQ